MFGPAIVLGPFAEELDQKRSSRFTRAVWHVGRLGAGF
jgi:hypothetical protein